jgi:hypothetical protein
MLWKVRFQSDTRRADAIGKIPAQQRFERLESCDGILATKSGRCTCRPGPTALTCKGFEIAVVEFVPPYVGCVCRQVGQAFQPDVSQTSPWNG